MNNSREAMDQVKEMTVRESRLFTCDKGCGEGFEIGAESFKVERFNGVNADGLPDRIDKYFFVCPGCGAEYVSYYADSDMRATRERAGKLLGRIERLDRLRGKGGDGDRDKGAEDERRQLEYGHGLAMGQFRGRARRLRKVVEG